MKSSHLSILFISDSDISIDSRILKAIDVSINDFNVHAFGISSRIHKSKSNYNSSLSLELLTPRSRKLSFVPSKIRHFLTLLEFYFFSLFNCFKVNPDVIYCNDFVSLPLSVFLKLIFNSRLIYDAHELESNKNGLSNVSKYFTYYSEKFLWRFIDGFITVSESIESWYIHSFGPKYSIVIINSPSYLQYSDSDYLRLKYNIPSSELVFIYVGYLLKGRSLELLVNLFSNLVKDKHLILLGNGPLKTRLQNIAYDAHNVHFHEFVEHSSVVEIVSSADVGLCLIENISLSDYYSLPNKLFEYSFAGLHVIGSNFPEISKFIELNSIGTTSDLNYDSLYDTIFNYSPKNNAISHSDLFCYSWEVQSKSLSSFLKTFS